MKIVIIGGKGHVGSYLVPRLVQAGHEVICISRNSRSPYIQNSYWEKVTSIQIDRTEEEANHAFGKKIAELSADIVIDMICFNIDSAKQIVESLKGKIQHYLFCGTIWVHGSSRVVPITEDAKRTAFDEYGIQKTLIEEYLHSEASINNFPATIIHPGHIVGEGWAPISPLGNINTDVFVKLAKGQTVTLPNFGLETVHHVHADDVAQLFMKAIANRSVSIGESFHAVSEAAITLKGFAEEMAAWFGQEAKLEFLPWDTWRLNVTEDEAVMTLGHILRSHNCSIEKAKRLLGYQPRYSSLEAVQQSVSWLIDNHSIKI